MTASFIYPLLFLRLLSSSLVIRPPMRPQECKAEEDALLACTPSSANRGCAEQIHSYKQCADTVLFRLMNPALR